MNRRNPPVTCGDIFLAGDGNPFVREADISPGRGIAFNKGDKTLVAISRCAGGCLPLSMGEVARRMP